MSARPRLDKASPILSPSPRVLHRQLLVLGRASPSGRFLHARWVGARGSAIASSAPAASGPRPPARRVAGPV